MKVNLEIKIYDPSDKDRSLTLDLVESDLQKIVTIDRPEALGEAIRELAKTFTVFYGTVSNICAECGEKFGSRIPETATWHDGTCDVCQGSKAVVGLK